MMRFPPSNRLCVLAALCATLAMSGRAQSPPTFRQKMRTFHTQAEFTRMTAGRVRMLAGQAVRAVRQPLPNLPITPFKIATQSASAVWLATGEGAIRLRVGGSGGAKPPGQETSAASEPRERSGAGAPASAPLEYFAGQRWLPDDRVLRIGVERDGEVAWIETSKGFARIEDKPMTLSEKSRVFVERIQARHNRWGLTADSQLRAPGDLSTNQMVSSDNDGLWTAIYVAAEAFRFKVTRDVDARAHARRGMQAIMRLEEITGRPGFPARSFIRVGQDLQPKDGEWHDTPDQQWRWKGDTSSDEIVGHYFVYPIYYDLLADEDEKPRLRAAIERITNHILDNKYQLIDVDGQRTRWGWWGPDAIWEDPDETGLRALHLLSHLRVALHMTADATSRAKFQSAYDELVRTHKYHLLTRNQKIMVPGSINHSDDELAFLSYYPLLRYEADPKLLEVYRHSLERSWQIERPERNPLWNVIYAAGTGAKEFDQPQSLRTLREIPMDMIKWDVRNSHRQDVPVDPMSDRFKRRQALIVLPYDELPMWKWNGNPYNLDGGSGGRSEDDGAYFLLPYWMGRYHRLIEE